MAWSAIFFFASAAASSAYLTVGETFPLEVRAIAIALFYAFGTGVGGVAGPAVFGALIQTGSRQELFMGYLFGGVLMMVAGAVAFVWGHGRGEAVAGDGRRRLCPRHETTVACRRFNPIGKHAVLEDAMVDENRVEGAWDKLKGNVKEGAGKLTGDEKLEAEGKADQVKGSAKSAVGGAKDTVRDALDK